MSQVSKFPIHRDVEKRMFEIFKSSISDLRNSEDIDDFLEDVLSPSEKIMLAKRLAIAVLLAKGYIYPSIAKILRVTPTTISTVSLRLKYSGRGYKRIVNKILSSEKKDEFWNEVEDILANIPNSKGSSWVYQKNKVKKDRLKKRKPF